MESKHKYIGNSWDSGTVHGMRSGRNNITPYVSLCGVIYSHEIKVNLNAPAEKEATKLITCERCRSILDLHDDHPSVEPDYFLITEINTNLRAPIPIAICDTMEDLKHAINCEINNRGRQYVKDHYRIVGVKEVERLLLDVIPREYDIVLTKQQEEQK